MRQNAELPPVICGPILRKLTSKLMVLWWVSPKPFSGRCMGTVAGSDAPLFEETISTENTRMLKTGERAWVHLLSIDFPGELEEGTRGFYSLEPDQGERLEKFLPHLVYPGEPSPSFTVRMQVKNLLHGSCRNPHYDSPDSYLGADDFIGKHLDSDKRPSFLMLTGDQIYADDVAGPMLHAIHQVIDLLGFADESFEQAVVPDSQALYQSSHT